MKIMQSIQYELNTDVIIGFIYGSSHTKLGQWLILRVVVFEHILSIFIIISPP